MIGTRAKVSIGALRSIQVFVMGEAAAARFVTVSGLSSMTNALFASGGVREIGSLRSIRLMRGGRLVRQLDLYDMLLRGDTSGDARLLPGDVIFIPPVGATVTATGEVRRPAIYELKEGEHRCGTPQACGRAHAGGRYAHGASRTRGGPAANTMAMTLDLSGGPGLETRLQSATSSRSTQSATGSKGPLR
jgi:protein involved in polysaccharide export with SLBB domain